MLDYGAWKRHDMERDGFRLDSSVSFDFDAMSSVGDPLADAVVARLTKSPLSLCDEILDGLHNDVPQVGAFLYSITSQPAWLDRAAVERGANVFWTHALSMITILTYDSLVGGFGVPRINDVLSRTGQLSNPKRAMKRLVETALMQVYAFQVGGLEIGSQGFREVIKVRLIHASVRHRQRNLPSTDGSVRINQADMLVTILSFQANVILNLPKMGIKLSDQDASDFTHMWRYIGYLSGVQDCFNPCSNGVNSSLSTLVSYLTKYYHPDASATALVDSVLEALSDPKSPYPTISYQLNVAFAHRLFMAPYFDSVGLTVPSILHQWQVSIVFLFQRLYAQISRIPFLRARILTNRRSQNRSGTHSRQDELERDQNRMKLWIVCSLIIGLVTHGLKSGSLSISGAFAASILGLIIFSHPSALFSAILLAFYLSSSRLTKLKAEFKETLEEDHAKGGSRTAIQVLSNGLTGALICLVHGYVVKECADKYHVALVYGYLGHFSCCNGDTWASEVGVLSTLEPWHIITWKRVPRGTNGGVSILGLIASLAGGAFIGLIASLFPMECLPRPFYTIFICSLAGLLGSLVFGVDPRWIRYSEQLFKRPCIIQKRVKSCQSPTGKSM